MGTGPKESISILFVCLGNICRSPTAEGVFRKLAADDSQLSIGLKIDSAGTGDWHVGNPPDKRATYAARQRGYDLSALRARQVCQQDFVDFDYILAMDRDNERNLLKLSGGNGAGKIKRFLTFSESLEKLNGFSNSSGGNPSNTLDVPDPYFGGDEGFETVLNLIESASLGLIEHLKNPESNFKDKSDSSLKDGVSF